MSTATRSVSDDAPESDYAHSVEGPGSGIALSVLPLGGEGQPIAGVRWHSDLSKPCPMIAIVGPIDPSRLMSVLEAVEDPAIPVANFTGRPHARIDFSTDSLTAETLSAAAKRFEPIWKRLAAFPFIASRRERPEMTILRLAYSRDVSIEASWNVGAKTVVAYDLLEPSQANQERLESLATMGAFRRRHFTRTHTCVRCSSARLLAYEACPSCGGADLADERIVHHYRCGAQEAESHFIRGRRLVCPKCRRDLRHFGMDYGKSGVIVHCRSCGTSHGEPDPHFACLDCGNVVHAGKALQTDWYHYDLTETGLRALKEGRLPVIASQVDSRQRPHAQSVHEFRLLASAALHGVRRFQRPFTIVELHCANHGRLVNTYSVTTIRAALRSALGTVIGAVPETDFSALTSADTIVIGFPETKPAEATKIVDDLTANISLRASIPLRLEAKYFENDEIAALLARL